MADSRFKIPQLPQISTNSLLGRDTAGDGNLEIIGVSGGIEFTGSGGLQTSAFTGDATKTAGGTALTLATVNSNVGSFGSATQVAGFTVNAKGLITAASNTTISIPSTQVSDFTEAVQDVLGAISVDSNTLDWTYNDASNTLTANVKTQMSLTSDASGIKLTNDAASPGNSQYYGTNGSGVKGYYALPGGGGSSSGVTGSVQFSDGAGGFLSDATNFFWDNTAKMLEIDGTTGTNYAVLITGQAYGVSVAPTDPITGAVNAFNVVADATGLVTNNISNTNTVSGGARLQLSTQTGSTGDPYVIMAVGDQNYSLGIDNSDTNNIFVIGNGTSPSTVTTPNFALNGFLTGVGGVTNPTSKLHLPAGTATASTAPLKFTSGTALTTPEDGAMEYHGSHLYFTIGSTRYQLDQQGGGSTSWADLVSGTQTGSLTATLAINETFAMNYAGGNFAFYADDATSTFKAFSKDQTQYVEINNTDVRIGSGTSRLQYIDGSLRIYDSDATHYVSIQTAATGSLTTNLGLTLPSTTGSANNVLVTDGTGVLSWADANTISGDVDGPAGSVDSEIALFSGITGKVIKRATGTGLVTATAGVYGTVTAPTGDVVGTSATQTLTNKRIDPRVSLNTSVTAPAPDVSTTDIYIMTALAGNCTFGVPIGTPVQGQKLIYRIKDNGTARTLSYNSGTNGYRAMGVVLPTTTVISKTLYLGCIYNATDLKWDVVAVNLEA